MQSNIHSGSSTILGEEEEASEVDKKPVLMLKKALLIALLILAGAGIYLFPRMLN
jgi:hypothetical protein